MNIEQFNNMWYEVPVQAMIFPSSNSEEGLKKGFITTILLMPREEDRGKAENQVLFKKQDRIASILQNASSISEFDEGLKDYMSILLQYGFPRTHEAIKTWYFKQDWNATKNTQLPSSDEEKPNYFFWGSIILGVYLISRKIK